MQETNLQLCENANAALDNVQDMFQELLDNGHKIEHIEFVYLFANNYPVDDARDIVKNRHKKSRIPAITSRLYSPIVAHMCDSLLQNLGQISALSALISIVQNPAASDNARISAANSLKDWGQFGSDNRNLADRPIGEMTVEELDRAIRELQAKRQPSLADDSNSDAVSESDDSYLSDML